MCNLLHAIILAPDGRQALYNCMQ